MGQSGIAKGKGNGYVLYSNLHVVCVQSFWGSTQVCSQESAPL